MKKNNRPLKAVFYTLLGVFATLLVSILTPISFFLRESSEIFAQVYLYLFFGSAVAVFFLGIALIILTLKAKVKGRQKIYLLLTGSSPVALVVFAILHNFFDYFVETTTGALGAVLEVLSVSSFFLAVFAAPVAFIVGVVGSIIYFRKKKK